jgi:hypothetical protein
LHQVVGKRVLVVDHQQHKTTVYSSELVHRIAHLQDNFLPSVPQNEYR